MIGLLIIIGIIAGFYNLAKRHDLNGYVWGALSLLAWFGGQFITAFLLVIVNPRALDDIGAVYIWSFAGSLAGLAILYFILKKVAKNKIVSAPKESDDLIDDTYLK